MTTWRRTATLFPSATMASTSRPRKPNVIPRFLQIRPRSARKAGSSDPENDALQVGPGVLVEVGYPVGSPLSSRRRARFCRMSPRSAMNGEDSTAEGHKPLAELSGDPKVEVGFVELANRREGGPELVVRVCQRGQKARVPGNLASQWLLDGDRAFEYLNAIAKTVRLEMRYPNLRSHPASAEQGLGPRDRISEVPSTWTGRTRAP